jgi:predicted helicase
LNNLEAVLIKVGTPLLDKYGDVANAISEVFKAVGSSIDAGAFDSIYKALNEFGSDIESFFLSLAKNLPEALKGIKFDALIKSFRDLGLEIKKVFEAFFGDIDLSTADGLRKALQGIVDAFSGLTYYVSGVVSSFKDWSSVAGEAVRSLSGMDSG